MPEKDYRSLREEEGTLMDDGSRVSSPGFGGLADYASTTLPMETISMEWGLDNRTDGGGNATQETFYHFYRVSNRPHTPTSPTDARHWANCGLMLGQRRRRWSSIKPTMDQYITAVGSLFIWHLCLFKQQLLSSTKIDHLHVLNHIVVEQVYLRLCSPNLPGLQLYCNMSFSHSNVGLGRLA